MSAVTDSRAVVASDPARPGITNLLEIFGAMTGRNPKDIPADFEGKGYGDFKKILAEVAVETLSPIRRKFDELMENKDYLLQVLKAGASAAQKRAWKILAKVYRKAGFVEPLR